MTTTHTPGPWTTYKHSRGIDVIVDDGSDGIDVATVRNPADARLIAAAPDLLAALETLRDMGLGANAYRVACAAIASATA